MRLIDADALKRQYEAHKRLFCRNRIEFSTLSDKDKARVDELDSCIADILNAPNIEERKTGKWIYVNGHTAINCSACYHCSWSLSFEHTVKRFKFCPNCGAKMEEGDHT